MTRPRPNIIINLSLQQYKIHFKLKRGLDLIYNANKKY